MTSTGDKARIERLMASLAERWDERGHGPIGRALASPAPIIATVESA